MTNKIPNNSGNKSANNIFQNKNFKKIRIIFIPIFLTTGLIIGWSLNYFLFSTNARDHSAVSSKHDASITKTDVKNNNLWHYDFLNPYVLTTVYDKINHQELSNFKDLFNDYIVNAKKDKSIKQISVYFRDLATGAWFGINEKEKFIPASLTKVPVLLAVYQIAEKNPEYLNKKLMYKGSIAETYLKAHPEIPDIRTTMLLNESYSIEQLVDLMITKSDNEAAMLLLNDIGNDKWMALQKRLGNSVPLTAGSSTNIITVKSYSAFFRILYNSSLLSREYSNKALEILSRSEYNKGIRLAVPSNIQICHKYGERDTLVNGNDLKIQQLHHAGIVYYPGKPFFICVMTKGSDKQKMERIIFDVSKIAYQQVDKQVKTFQKPDITKDIE